MCSFEKVEEFVIELLKFNEDCRFGYATLLQINLIRGDKPSIEKAIEVRYIFSWRCLTKVTQ